MPGTLRHSFQEYPHEYFGYFNDFLNGQDYIAADWVITTTEAGVGSATEALAQAGIGGHLVITNDAADNDLDFLQQSHDGGTTALEAYSFVAGKKLSFMARFKVLEVLQCDFVLGLQITDTTPLAVSDGVFFRCDDGDALLDAVICKDATETVLAGVHTMVADTFVEVELYYDGRVTNAGAATGGFEVIVNGVNVGTLVLTNAPDDEELCISFGIMNGEAVANIMTLDYISVVQQR